MRSNADYDRWTGSLLNGILPWGSTLPVVCMGRLQEAKLLLASRHRGRTQPDNDGVVIVTSAHARHNLSPAQTNAKTKPLREDLRISSHNARLGSERCHHQASSVGIKFVLQQRRTLTPQEGCTECIVFWFWYPDAETCVAPTCQHVSAHRHPF